MRAKHALIVCSLVVAALTTAGLSVVTANATTTDPPTTYYLSLGDSLSTNGGATAGHAYPDDLYATEKSIIPGLQLVKLGCSGDSTTRMIHGGLCKNYTTGNQLGDAEAFLASHAGSVKFVTIDIGGDDVNGCAPNGVINDACVQKGLQAIAANMQTILGGLRAAGGDVRIVGMTYYDPWLAYWLKGPSGQQTATASLGLLHQLNSELRSAYRQYGARIAAVQKAFQSWDMALTGSFNGQTVPQDVANICKWTHMCDASPNNHTNDAGHALLATTFQAKVKFVR